MLKRTKALEKAETRRYGVCIDPILISVSVPILNEILDQVSVNNYRFQFRCAVPSTRPLLWRRATSNVGRRSSLNPQQKRSRFFKTPGLQQLVTQMHHWQKSEAACRSLWWITRLQQVSNLFKLIFVARWKWMENNGCQDDGKSIYNLVVCSGD